jgi:2-amino-4-hydroxy-6-hydroxymethyldihydropteridine diphosphokinase
MDVFMRVTANGKALVINTLVVKTIYISLGSNVEPQRYLRAAVTALRAQFGEVTCSSVYRSAAVGFNGDDFLNLVARAATNLPVSDVQQQLRRIEDANDRRRDVPRFSPRTLDLDLLLYGDEIISAGGVVLPRAEILTQAFVLKPLSDLAPDGLHPVVKRSYAQLWQEFDKSAQPLTKTELVL